MACIISLLGVERASRHVVMFSATAIFLILCTQVQLSASGIKKQKCQQK